MAGHKRPLDDGTSAQKSKKTKLSSEKSDKKTDKGDPVPSTSAMTLEEIDFPRGGGTTLTPLEVKTVRAEAVREADQELFGVSGPIVVKD
jgi:rRNA biogenesis protein RRP5